MINVNKKRAIFKYESKKTDKLERRSWVLNAENSRRSLLNMNKFDSYEDLEAFRENDDSDQISLENDFLLNESKNIIIDYLIFSSPLFASNQD